ncbi:cytochrome P450 [Nocardia bovistercoris]|uniref:Cytochrome P450 n=1 Tax=Nocardia bovistercoris TaxID=2785916 RepID=A0A931N603_9NOCA|nr:cytochrome P450 [Nocardia bovistercoris]MBH0780424.1 cytochrome P450 [Nocardia bovistercoris]
MTSTSPPPSLDRDRVRELFDLRGPHMALSGGCYDGDPYPAWHRLRERAEVHPGVVHELTGYDQPAYFAGLPFPDRPHYSAFSFAACDTAYRNPEIFASSPVPVDPNTGDLNPLNSMLSMGGAQHRRYRTLVQPSFMPAKAAWWIRNWIAETVAQLIDGFVGDGRAELNVDFCAAIPVLTITGSFGVPVSEALDIRAALRDPRALVDKLAPIVAARREHPRDDLISVLVAAELTGEDGKPQRLTDAEIYSFAILLLTAGSGTTWKQMGIVLTALLQRPDVLAAVEADRTLLRPAVDEAVRWLPTDPMFSRYVTRDSDFHGVALPEGAVVHLCLGAANRDPARWELPDEYDITRKPRPSFGFGSGAHACLGMHLARAEITTGVNALLDRLPNLRLDPDTEPPRFIGMYERGATEIHVRFG